MVTSFFREILEWSYYIFDLLFSKISCWMVSWLVPWLLPFSLFGMDYCSQGSRRARRNAHRMADGAVILALNTSLMVLTEYMTFPWWSAVFAALSTWITLYLQSMDRFFMSLIVPIKVCQWWFPPWSPDDFITHVVMFGLVLSSQLYISFELFCQVGARIATNRQFALNAASRLLDTVSLCIVSPFLSKFDRYHSVLAKLCPKVLATVLSSCHEQVEASGKNIAWDMDSVQVVLDNSATTHVWNTLEHFVPGSIHYYDEDDDIGVITVGEEESKPLGVGVVIFKLRDSLGIVRDVRLEGALYFLASSVNVCGVTKLAEQLDDYEGTWIQTKRTYSIFKWDHEQYELEFEHPYSNLPMVSVNVGNSKFKAFTSFCSSMTRQGLPSALTTCASSLPFDQSDDIHFLKDVAPTCLPADVPSRRFCVRESVLFNYKVGDKLRYFHDDTFDLVDVLEVSPDPDTNIELYKILTSTGNELTVLQEVLAHPANDGVDVLPVTSDQVQNHLSKLSPEDLEALVHPVERDPLVSEFMA